MIKILVCVKQVPHPERIAVTTAADGSAVVESFSEYRLNRFDEFAVEAALHLQETVPAVCVDVISMGPQRAADAIKRALGMGAREGIHLLTPEGTQFPPAAVATHIAEYIRSRSYTVILTGCMSEDGMHGQVGPMTAAQLNLPHATQVICMQAVEDFGAMIIEKEVEGGARESYHIQLPAVLAVQPGINRPRYPSLSNLLRANRQPLETISVPSAQDPPEPVEFFGMVLPSRTRASEWVSGSLAEKAERFLAILAQKGFLRSYERPH
jgi:electron transfer flavoprotein beta subunit